MMCTGPYKAEVAFKVMDMLIILMLSLSNQNISLYFINTYEYVCIKKKIRKRRVNRIKSQVRRLLKPK